MPVPMPVPVPIPVPSLPDAPKPFWQSRVIIGGLIAIILPLVANFVPGLGLINPTAATDFVMRVLEVGGPIIGGLLAIQGRMVTTAPIAGTQVAKQQEQAIAAQQAHSVAVSESARDFAAEQVDGSRSSGDLVGMPLMVLASQLPQVLSLLRELHQVTEQVEAQRQLMPPSANGHD